MKPDHTACITVYRPWADPEGGGGGGGVGPPPQLKNHKNVGFLCKTGPGPLKNHKATRPAFNVWAIIVPSAKRHLNVVLLAGG